MKANDMRKFLLIFTGPDKVDYLLKENPGYVDRVLNLGATDYLLLTTALFNQAATKVPILTTSYINNIPESMFLPGKKAEVCRELQKEIDDYDAKTGYTLYNYTQQLINVAEGLMSRDEHVKLWFGLPQFLTFAQPAALGYVTFYRLYIIDRIVKNIPDENLQGFYFGQEEISPLYTPFDVNASGYGNAVYQCMVQLASIIKTQYHKKFMWIPYFRNNVATQPLNNITDIGLRIGYIANRTAVFDYVLLQPSALKDSAMDSQLQKVYNCITQDPPAVVSVDGKPVGGSILKNGTSVGFEMEIHDSYMDSTEAQEQYKKYVSTFGGYYNGPVPYAFYAGPQEYLTSDYYGVRQQVEKFFKNGK